MVSSILYHLTLHSLQYIFSLQANGMMQDPALYKIPYKYSSHYTTYNIHWVMADWHWQCIAIHSVQQSRDLISHHVAISRSSEHRSVEVYSELYKPASLVLPWPYSDLPGQWATPFIRQSCCNTVIHLRQEWLLRNMADILFHNTTQLQGNSCLLAWWLFC